jgi:phage tail protein X
MSFLLLILFLLSLTKTRTRLFFTSFDELGILTYQEYPYKQGERLDNIAMKFYGKPNFWWIIMEANPEIEDIQNIPAGTFFEDSSCLTV